MDFASKIAPLAIELIGISFFAILEIFLFLFDCSPIDQKLSVNN